jgi:drug/metabolite transporter (DMT)-like permease
MNSFSIGTISLLVSNVLLSSYPILIKQYITDISVLVQLIIRVVTYILLALPILVIGGEGLSIITNTINPKFLAISAVNLLHIYSSYKGFEYLNAGVSLTTFYSYPIIQVLLARIFLGTTLSKEIIYNLFGCLVGIGILNKESYYDTNTNIKKGFIFIAIAALTEAIIGVFYKKVNFSNPFMSLYTLYAPAFFLLLLVYIFFSNRIELHDKLLSKIEFNYSTLKKIILYNILIGGLGYALRLFSLSQISISWFSAVSFTGSVSAFLMGWFFLGEQIKIHHLLGSAVIFYNLYYINKTN